MDIGKGNVTFWRGKESLHALLSMLTGFELGKDVLFQARMKTTMVSMRTYYTQHGVHSSVKFIPLYAAKRTRKLS